MKRCTKCILPENYPGIILNERGICNHCVSHREQQYLGGEALREEIQSFLQTQIDRNRDYDCLLSFSGGRDSSYLLYYLVKVLNLRVLAYSLDNGCIPEQTMRNMKNMADRLNVKLVIEKNECLQKCIKHHMSSFIHRPSAPMIGLLCTGCRLGMDTRIPGFARENRIPVLISGSNPLDVRSYKQKIIALNPNSGKMYSYVLGYLLQVIRNPMWVLSYNCLVTQIKEYYHHFVRGPGRREDELQIAPFYRYIRWDEKEITSKLENDLDWRKHPDTESTWRGDCDIALLKLYLYKEMLGHNDQDEGLSFLVRGDQISREQALERLKKEGDVPEEVIKEILGRLGFDFLNLKMALEPVLFSQSVSRVAAL